MNTIKFLKVVQSIGAEQLEKQFGRFGEKVDWRNNPGFRYNICSQVPRED